MESTRLKGGRRLSFSGKKTLSSFMEVSIASLKRSGKLRTSETYMTTFSSFMKFMKGKDILLSNLDSDLMVAYEAHLKEQGVSLNTISFYMRILRATYNRAVEKGVTRQRYPFKHVYTGIEKTVKRAVTFKVIKQIKEMDLSYSSSLEYARDMFLFSFYTRGMSFIDMAYLKKTDLENGVLTYRRKKTGQLLSIKWEPCMQDIVDKYSVKKSPYLLPIIENGVKDERKQYKSAICFVNRKLKEIGKMLELPHALTMYVARHSWASIAKEKNIPVSIISEGMGHDSEKTTLIYLASLDTTVVDNANMLILNDLL
jgi:integrase